MKILILRSDNIGDLVLFSGAFQHIRKLYPDAYITLAVQKHIVNLAELCPYIDKCVPAAQLTWWGLIENIRIPVKHKMKKAINLLNRLWNSVVKPFDIVFVPIRSTKVEQLEIVYCLNSKLAIGIFGCNICTPKAGYPPELKPEVLFSSYLDVSKMDAWRHEFYNLLDYLRLLGCSVSSIDDVKPQLWLSDLEKSHLGSVKETGRKIVGIFPGASCNGRRWDVYNYGELAELLGDTVIYAIFGSSEDEALASQVSQQIRKGAPCVQIIDLAGQTTLRELVKTIMSCDLLISMETSGLHIAIATGIPSIGIVGGGHFGRFVPWGTADKNIFLTKDMYCFHCNWLCINEDLECIKAVSAYEVSTIANKILGINAVANISGGAQ